MRPPLLAGPVTFQGDAHGKLNKLAHTGHPVIQLGDLGLGFVHRIKVTKYVTARKDFWFIRGNHDNPALCQQNPRHLGDFGGDSKLFWLGGAWSIDQHVRTPFRDWWPDEELNFQQSNAALEAYQLARPRVMISHDAPSSLFTEDGPMAIRGFRPSHTSQLLQHMLQIHTPEIWLFGHHHLSRQFIYRTTRFQCLAELETTTLQIQD